MEIRGLQSEEERERCAQMMSVSDPWLTLGRNYEQCLESLRKGPAELYVAVDEDEVRGFIMLMMVGALVGYIRIVCIDPTYRGHGLGTQLVSFAEERIFKESPNVWLFVTSFNTRARALYKRLGYQVIGEVPDYIVPGYSEVLMRKTLGPLVEFTKRSR
ncbi:MAG TPA: GNAT family N-acetyltransferase [Thermoanaerobaculia bacterium]|nr:GNAT family N-acetyltransferase [Thermoanaerobaculia bacterium]